MTVVMLAVMEVGQWGIWDMDTGSELIAPSLLGMSPSDTSHSPPTDLQGCIQPDDLTYYFSWAKIK